MQDEIKRLREIANELKKLCFWCKKKPGEIKIPLIFGNHILLCAECHEKRKKAIEDIKKLSNNPNGAQKPFSGV